MLKQRLLREGLALVLVAVLAIVLLAGCATPTPTAPEEENIVFATSAEGSSSYALAASLSTVVKRYGEGKILVTPRPTAGSVVAHRETGLGKADISSAMLDLAGKAVQGTGPYETEPFQGADKQEIIIPSATIFYGWWVPVDLADEFKCWKDVAGHNVFMNPPATQPYEVGIASLKALGIYDSVNALKMDYKAVSDALKMGEVDAIFTYGTPVTPSYFVELEAANHVVPVQPTDEELKTIAEQLGPVEPATWAYSATPFVHDVGLEEGGSLVIYGSLVTTKGLVSEMAAYNLIKIMSEHGEELVQGSHHWKFTAGLTPEETIKVFRIANSVGVKVHAGAYKYWKERGIDLEAEGIQIAD